MPVRNFGPGALPALVSAAILSLTPLAVSAESALLDAIGSVVDMQQPIEPGMALWPGDPVPGFRDVATIEADGYFLREFSIGEHSGTHVNAAASFIAGGSAQEANIGPHGVAPAVVIDARAEAAANPDYALTVDKVQEWEAKNGPIPAGSIVLMSTGWAAKWLDQSAFFNADADGGLHFPGFAGATTRWLIDNRNIAGVGIDTHGVDPGQDEEFQTNTLMAERNGIVLECLNNMDQLPPTGAVLVVGGLRLVGGSGSPAAVTALLPKQ